VNVAVYVVNYRADEHLLEFARSLRTAEERCPTASVTLHVHDNSERAMGERESFAVGVAAVHAAEIHFPAQNDGYFGGLERSQSLLADSTDCVLYCNPDVILAPDFFKALVHLLPTTEKGILAPSIVATDGFDQNPKHRSRLPARKLRMLEAIYSNAVAFGAFTALARVKELRRAKADPGGARSERIYAAHGAVFVFSDLTFFKGLPRYPCFLFGEELFVAEEARQKKVPTTYAPSLRVLDSRHACIGLIGSRARRLYQLDSLRFLLAEYYRAERQGE
jgi:GT2 family glycosyltransferase